MVINSHYSSLIIHLISHPGVMHIILETPRLILSRFSETDAPLLYQLNSDPEVVKYIHEPTLKNDQEALQVLTDIILPQYQTGLGRWAIHTKDTNEFVGWCGLKYLKETDEIDLGYRLRQSAWGKGFATEAAKHTLVYGFNQLHLKEIVGKAHVENAGSIHVLQKIGMEFIMEVEENNEFIKVFRAVSPV